MAAHGLNHSTILLVEDEPLLRRRIAAQLGKAGAEVTAVSTLAEARQALRGLEFDFALLDLHLPDGESLVLLDDKVIPESAVTVIMTAEGGVAGAVEAMRRGATDYLVKPFDLDELTVRLLHARGSRHARRAEQHRRAQQAVEDQGFFFRTVPRRGEDAARKDPCRGSANTRGVATGFDRG